MNQEKEKDVRWDNLPNNLSSEQTLPHAAGALFPPQSAGGVAISEARVTGDLNIPQIEFKLYQFFYDELNPFDDLLMNIFITYEQSQV